MQRRAFAKTLAAAALIPSTALADEEPRVARYVWGRPGAPEPLLVRGVVVAESEPEFADKEIFVLLGPSNWKGCAENYTARVTSRGCEPSRELLDDLNGLFANKQLYTILSPRGSTKRLEIGDVPTEATLPLLTWHDDVTDVVLVVEREPESAQVRVLAELGVCFRRAVAIEGQGCRYLVSEDIDLTGWTALPDSSPLS